jgi:hypothetical protein
MTPEQKANELADAFAEAEAAAAKLTNKMRAFLHGAAGVGPITRLAFVRQCQGVEGDIAALHIGIKQYDPRPQPFDGGGGK